MPNKKVLLTKSAGAPHVPSGVYIGCDQSISGTGLAAFDHEGNFLGDKLISSKPVKHPPDKCQRIIDIFANMYQWIISVSDGEQPCVVLEDFAYSQVNQMALLGGLGYHIRIMLSRTSFNFGVASPGVLKKFVSGKGNCGKSAMILGAYKRWGYETDNDNLADAYGLGKLAWVTYAQPFAGTMGTRKADFECAEKVEIYR